MIIKFDPKRLANIKKKKHDPIDQSASKRDKKIVAPSKLATPQSSPEAILIDVDTALISIALSVKLTCQLAEVACLPPKESAYPR